jgi:nucleotide-binding universal stress UspA family protein
LYQRILTAVDDSPISDLALQQAIKLAHTTGAVLRLIHVADVVALNRDSEFDDLNQIVAPLEAAGLAVLERGVQKAKDAGLQAESHLIELDRLGRHVADAIVEEAKHWNADLIVVGSHGRRGFRRWALGSVAEGVMRLSDRAVLLIRQE